jgi:alanine racemase
VTTLFRTSFQKFVTTKNEKLITLNLTNTTIKLEQRKDLKNARNKKKKKTTTHLNPIITFIQLH